MEYEICRKEAQTVKRNYEWPIIISLSWIFISFMINVIVGLSESGEALKMFEVGGAYWAGFGNMILGAFLAIVFWSLSLVEPIKVVVVLTNKRILYFASKKLLFSKESMFTENYNLNKINNYSYQTITKEGVYLYSILKIYTSSSVAQLAVDDEFYNRFVAIVNSVERENK